MRTVDWSEHLGVDGTLAVDCTSGRSAITHTQFAALKVKDAVVDQFRERTGVRPSVDVAAPDVRLNLHLDRDIATLAIDLAGDSLHRRGYRGAQGAAPLKENLAAAMLLRSGWAKLVAADDGELGFVDPMCGSGSLAIEAALIAADVAPGLLRNDFGFLRWRGHDEAVWQRLLTEAAERRAAARSDRVVLRAYDRDPAAVRATLDNAVRAGFAKQLHAERRELADLPAAPAARGLLAVNPPYGERLGEAEALKAVYALLGDKLRESYVGWQAAVLTGNPPLGRELRIKAKRTHTMFNGPIECRLLRFDVEPKHFEQKRVPGALPAFDTAAARARPGAAMFANRLAQESRRRSAPGRARTASPAIACTTPTCPSTRSRSISTRQSVARRAAVRLRAGVRAARDDRAREGAGAARRGVQRDSRGARRAARARVPAHATQAEGRRAVRRSSPNAASSTWSAKAASSCSSTSRTTSTPGCSSIIGRRGRVFASSPPARAS